MTPHERYNSQIGQKFGMLTFVGISDKRGDNYRILGRFVCECGNEATFHAARVFNQKYRTHCGCQTDKGAHRTHGMRDSIEYSSWQAMKARCLNQSSKDYPRYGARGISVCEEWINSFESFFAEIGPRPEGTSLDRIDNAKGYEPGNIRWADPKTQGQNRRGVWCCEIDGQFFSSMTDAARTFGVSVMTIVRWCDGYTDIRRKAQKNGGVIKPKPNCRRWRSYDD